MKKITKAIIERKIKEFAKSNSFEKFVNAFYDYMEVLDKTNYGILIDDNNEVIIYNIISDREYKVDIDIESMED